VEYTLHRVAVTFLAHLGMLTATATTMMASCCCSRVKVSVCYLCTVSLTSSYLLCVENALTLQLLSLIIEFKCKKCARNIIGEKKIPLNFGNYPHLDPDL